MVLVAMVLVARQRVGEKTVRLNDLENSESCPSFGVAGENSGFGVKRQIIDYVDWEAEAKKFKEMYEKGNN